ncbi:LysE family translocator [Mesorhizobium sp. M00.F.Ca.ET.186.01.1.1]|nr:LysE family translocator [bacterium M00.F.Ca.ET.205.01.1.1]TGU55996.1 LysE family translocator [bacterium M00.F.Ca.ET.152.01.1.1]TGV40560.1 LysE family translocator [Mesorhizobium sp. M00.F.Ca.ET.186.01.1.1]TGZ45558.1 LysE family translocator [bacterium M00.F.Ca.ET.162.01.1.1]
MLVTARGIGQGRAVALFTVLGMTAGAGIVQLPLLAFGVSSLVLASPLAFKALQWGGAVYLIWLGVRMFFAEPMAYTPRSDKILPLAAAKEGMIANLLNPWSMTFMVAFLPQFVDPAHGHVNLQLLVLGTTQKLTGLIILAIYALASGSLGAWIAQRPKVQLWHQRVAGCLIVLLGLRLVLVGRVTR